MNKKKSEKSVCPSDSRHSLRRLEPLPPRVIRVAIAQGPDVLLPQEVESPTLWCEMCNIPVVG